MMYRRLAIFLSILNLAAAPLPATAAPSLEQRIVSAALQVLIPRPTDLDGVLTVASGGIYVQCLEHAPAANWRCEAAGFEGQSWLYHVLTVDRQKALIAKGFEPDSRTGNFLRIVPRTLPPAELAALIVSVLADGYGVQRDDVDVYADWLVHRRCPIRLGANNVSGGAIITPQYAFANVRYATTSCTIEASAKSLNYRDPSIRIPQAPGAGAVDLDARYGSAMAAQLRRVQGRTPEDDRYAIFSVGTGYVQCLADLDDKAMYCEAASDDAIGPSLDLILTPARKQALIKAGFRPPGQSINYARYYPFKDYDSRRLARTLLAVLHDAYGYEGAPELMLSTERGPRDQPLLAGTIKH